VSNTLSESQQKQINDIIRKFLEDKNLQFEPSSTFEELGCDSLDFVAITMELEDIFGIAMNTSELDKVKSVNDLYDYMAIYHATRFQT
jgi:acyl carrier protein